MKEYKKKQLQTEDDKKVKFKKKKMVRKNDTTGDSGDTPQ